MADDARMTRYPQGLAHCGKPGRRRRNRLAPNS